MMMETIKILLDKHLIIKVKSSDVFSEFYREVIDNIGLKNISLINSGKANKIIQ